MSKYNRTLAIVKPDAVERGLDGKVVAAALEEGFRLVAAKRGIVTAKGWRRFYAEHDGKPFFEPLVTFMASGPVLVIALEWVGVAGDPNYVVQRWRWLLGATDSRNAGPGTLRARFGDKTGDAIYRNVAHGSDSHEAAEKELAFFFHPSDLDPHSLLVPFLPPPITGSTG